MQIKKQTTSRKYLIIGLILLLLLGGVAAFAFLSPLSPFSTKDNADRPENTVSYEPATEEQKKAGEEAKKEALKRQEAEEQQSQQPSKPADVKTADMTISSAAQNAGMLQIRTTIETRDAAGKCVLTLSKEGRTNVIQEAGTQIQGSYSVCKGFDVPVSSMAKGMWQATITYTGIGSKGEASQQIEVQ